ncbi:MAG: hypothetical protein R3335_10485, partial [Anaerolineales bacterium]|nr:hypothetical protein [Anaerolineales bacterium]
MDLFSLLAHALWVLGAAFGLAVVSYACWEAGARREGLRQSFARPSIRQALAAAGVLFCLG